ncbi:MAG: peptidoglycan-associated lipoprotein Pal [Syntrophales bacterium]|nr:peptidoglycan-associated lipoprotein Pal [Syntrophales bacterium]
MKRNGAVFTIIVLTICMALMISTGCAKKAVVKEEAPMKEAVVEKQAPMPAPTDEAAKERARKEAEEKARQEAEARQRAAMEKEKAMAEEAAMAEAKIEKEASGFQDIHFDFDRYNLKDADRKILDTHAKWLMDHPDYMVKIEGNCDERGTDEYNLALGEKRAWSARDYLSDLGVSKERISTISYGKERPLDPGHSEEAWAKNRRDHFDVTKKK